MEMRHDVPNNNNKRTSDGYRFVHESDPLGQDLRTKKYPDLKLHKKAGRFMIQIWLGFIIPTGGAGDLV